MRLITRLALLVGPIGLLSSCTDHFGADVNVVGGKQIITFSRSFFGFKQSFSPCLRELAVYRSNKVLWQIKAKTEKCVIVRSVEYGTDLGSFNTLVASESLVPGVPYEVNALSDPLSYGVGKMTIGSEIEKTI
jgi:hypothetical protein